MDNLLEPFFKACLALIKGTPVISNKTVPTLTGAHQNATEPFPLPIRFSVGVCVTGICGKIFIQILPRRFNSRFMHCLTASI